MVACGKLCRTGQCPILDYEDLPAYSVDNGELTQSPFLTLDEQFKRDPVPEYCSMTKLNRLHDFLSRILIAL